MRGDQEGVIAIFYGIKMSGNTLIRIIIQEDIIQETLPMGYSRESQTFK
jgi:hypothetical protein